MADLNKAEAIEEAEMMARMISKLLEKNQAISKQLDELKEDMDNEIYLIELHRLCEIMASQYDGLIELTDYATRLVRGLHELHTNNEREYDVSVMQENYVDAIKTVRKSLNTHIGTIKQIQNCKKILEEKIASGEDGEPGSGS